ncbi:carbohydrate ABC transporter membrane protein 2 (CUT1 family) [Microcella putealis]|uniref:Carbohydrate ABC transporter membrane protein 2 (CUT1 family) n=1 Tax=Microcella putealis TaxID=337005 RepID=A0A4Q7LNF4_9MICO|nr:carbohydrate ABC transporter permease [Microcella putealis]RZS55109.1 carbohydrate ABC transporter membrane protein 2 (CUT1 family) [Microcella putealis]TQM19645.1 carbohydrate ABC transporter membrane protein 2 (CUT1 family) [Microcella putealis]
MTDATKQAEDKLDRPLGQKNQPKPEGEVARTFRKSKEKLTSPWATAAAIIIAVIWTIPTFGLLVSSFRTASEIRSTGWWTWFVNPSFTLQNYNDVLFGAGASSENLGSYFVNSLVIAIPAALFPIAIATMAAYAFAWIKFRGSGALFVLVFALQIVPLQMALVPLLQIFSGVLGISGTFPAVWIAHTIFGLPLCIFLLHNFISEIPGEVIEAARVDGANHTQIFFRIIIPLSLPALASIGIFQFLWVWNDLLVALVFSGGTADVAPLTQRLGELVGNFGRFQERLPAAAFISLIVPLIVFFSLQRYFVRGLLAGSTKG